MRIASHLLIVTLDGQQYALPLSAVERVLRAVAVTSLPKMPEIVRGIVNVHGRVIPVIDLRKRFGLRDRAIEVSDRFIVVCTARRSVIVVVDEVVGILEYASEDIRPAAQILPGTTFIEGVTQLTDGMILIHNLDSLLSLDEKRALHQALSAA